MQVSHHKVVSFHYTLTNDAGDVVDSSSGGEPLAYLHGEQNIVAGLESALEGKAVGDSLQVTVEPADGYGEYNDALTQVVPKSMFQGVDDVEVGMQFQAETAGGVQVIHVAAVDGDDVTIDGNHPLAGERLHFDVSIEEIRESSDEEREHGHVHSGEGCC